MVMDNVALRAAASKELTQQAVELEEAMERWRREVLPLVQRIAEGDPAWEDDARTLLGHETWNALLREVGKPAVHLS
jgi:hypothetical protein